MHDYCEKAIKRHPELYDDITSMYELAEAESAENGNEDHECELAMDDVKDLIQYEDLV